MPYLDVGVKVLVRDEKLHNRQVVVGYSPVDGKTLIVIFGGSELGICLTMLSVDIFPLVIPCGDSSYA